MFKLLFLLFLLVFTAITAACEIAVVSMSRLRLRKLAADGSKTAKTILAIREKPQKFFGTVLVANNVVNSLIAVLSADILLRIVGFENDWTIVAATLVSAFLIIVTEVTAKTLASRYPEKFSWGMIGPLNRLILVLSPALKIVEFITDNIVKAIDRKRGGHPSLVTEEDIRSMIKIGEEEGVLQKDKYRMLSRVFDFGETLVKNVMTPSPNISAIDIDANFDDILDRVLEYGYSRVPVFRHSPDNIIGIVNMKDLLTMSCNRGLFVLQDIIYPPTVVSGNKKVTELLAEFQKGHTHLAVVVNDKGKVEGIVTLEDLLEEIVGEIEDEFDVRYSQQPKRPYRTS